ncbi:DUF805 domain-containing protein [Shimia marina]|uniref:Inner membrane protein YhaH n=1 Tax=Shimia marina TaxID=321267 RepID=A0A0P1FGD9_9RHOB|nr:DUF805 domain-containing protein [Shimia marina]CUH52877.1 Inner membrane protein YhaH [Shimia marina]SFD89369.1 Uncharacterized membrane protein YhaH, DUF805 family [Shimia marina]
MSKPVLQDIFSFSGRRNRKSYILFSLLMVVVTIVLSGITAGVATATAGLGLILLLLFVPLVVATWAVGSQRCRDFGWTGWAILITIIPGIGLLFAIAILFVPGTQGDNRYGPDPLGNAAGNTPQAA